MANLWDANGWVVAQVTAEHISASIERSSTCCMIASALKAAFPDCKRIAADLQTIRLSKGQLRYIFLTPHNAQDRLCAFDQGERDKVTPFVLRMRPCQISRSGKRRREPPSNAELRGSGLGIAKAQPHLEQRFKDGRRNLDPDRSDGLAPPPPKREVAMVPAPKRKPRVRAKVSTARKGAVPTTLGGRTPPTSILSRREFGLRQLRR